MEAAWARLGGLAPRLARVVAARSSVLDITCRLTALLLGLSLVLPALRIVLLVGGAAFLLRMAGPLTGFLPNVPAGTTLLRLLCSRGMTRRCCQDYRSDRNGEPTIPGEHDAPSNIPMNCNQLLLFPTNICSIVSGKFCFYQTKQSRLLFGASVHRVFASKTR
ncbi:hypothetical protein BUPH_04679 (plasmid) [Paraburkholderia phenoliruptrix BR3459a]|uniref:Uncharacterized protein n=1 Tax=Paraburkholderia phenoliruptrix BR3459a TaxID=1229205 RepID=K0DUS5_9BURK|nr:hypothetical protein BUPH_04679 [Paraburkholderia phenoliruptrix BR3459a]